MKRPEQESDGDWLRNIVLDTDADNERLREIADRLDRVDDFVNSKLEDAS